MDHPIVINTRGKVYRRPILGLIAKYIRSSAGRSQLAHSMMLPLRRRLDYQSIVHKAFVIDQLPAGALPIYDKGTDIIRGPLTAALPVKFKNNCVVINSHGKIGRRGAFARRVIFPTFEIYSNPTVQLSDIKSRRFSLIDRKVQTARNQIMEQKDSIIFQVLDNAGDKNGSNND